MRACPTCHRTILVHDYSRPAEKGACAAVAAVLRAEIADAHDGWYPAIGPRAAAMGVHPDHAYAWVPRISPMGLEAAIEYMTDAYARASGAQGAGL